MDIYTELVEILQLFEAEQIQYALCGGLAVAFYGYPRFTKDLLLVTDVFEAVFRDRELLEWQGITVQIVSRDGLATMKRLAGRRQDLRDLEKLELDDEES